MGKEETALQNAIRVALSEVGIVRRNNVGLFFTPDGRPIEIGIQGEADLTLFCKGGKTVFIEIKTAKGRQSKKQKKFQAAVERIGYEYIILRSIGEAEAFAERVTNER